MKRASSGVVVACLLIGFSANIRADDACTTKKCDRCGASACCLKKVCKPVPVEKELKEVCFDCKCEDFCVPGRSILCDTIYHDDACGCWVENVWKPTCAEVRTRKVIVKKEVVRKSQSFQWEMQTLCQACECLPPAAKGTPPSGKAPSGAPAEEVEEMQPEDQSIEEDDLSSAPPRPPSVIPVSANIPVAAPAKRSFWSFLR